MKRFLLPLLLLLLTQPAAAQFSRINSITLQNGNGTQAAFFASPFTLKVGTHCTWSVTGTVATMDCSGGGTTPAAPTGSVQYNAGAGALGAIPVIKNGTSNCDGFGDPCAFDYIDNDAFGYIVYGTEAMGAMGNFYDLYNNAGGWAMDSSNGTVSGNLAVYHGGSSLTNFVTGPGNIGFQIKPDHKSDSLSRYMISMHSGETPTTSDFTISAGWGTTATKDQFRGSDNNPEFTVTSAGTGQAANPTIVFTFKGGAFGATAQSWAGVCQMHGGTGNLADITYTSTTTTLTLTYNGTPVAASSYIIGCYGAVAGDN